MDIEILYFEGCPNHAMAVGRLQEALREERVSANVLEVIVLNSSQAMELNFLGSPSIRVNGFDVEPAARSNRDYGMACRTYLTANGTEGAPPVQLIREAVRQACVDKSRE